MPQEIRISANQLVVWTESTNGIAVGKVEWAWHIPGVFLALDGHSTLYLWFVIVHYLSVQKLVNFLQEFDR